MKKQHLLSIVILCIEVYCLHAQDTLSSGNALNIPFKKYGISIGNSREFNGIRINLADKNVRRINGVNLTGWYKTIPVKQKGTDHTQSTIVPNRYAIVNGINAGVLPMAGTMQPFNFGILGLFAKNGLNGLSVGGLFAYGDRINGICLAGLGLGNENYINGIAVGGLVVMSEKINGISISPLAVLGRKNIQGVTLAGLWAGEEPNGSKWLNEKVKIDGLTIAGFVVRGGQINGLTVSGLVVRGGEINGIPISMVVTKCHKNLKGLAITGIFMKSDVLKGLSIAGIVNNTNQTYGVSVGLINVTKELHGIQFGLLNYSGNNKKGLKILPIINMHLRKTKIEGVV